MENRIKMRILAMGIECSEFHRKNSTLKGDKLFESASTL